MWDVTLSEDACQEQVGNVPRVLAALWNAILNLIRGCGVVQHQRFGDLDRVGRSWLALLSIRPGLEQSLTRTKASSKGVTAKS